jgi:solute carrier family 25 oxoglutarate transporter 11
MVKTRIQILSGDNPGKKFTSVQVAKDLFYKEGGFKGFYRGIDSALTRQILYTGARVGIYNILNDTIK